MAFEGSYVWSALGPESIDEQCVRSYRSISNRQSAYAGDAARTEIRPYEGRVELEKIKTHRRAGVANRLSPLRFSRQFLVLLVLFRGFVCRAGLGVQTVRGIFVEESS